MGLEARRSRKMDRYTEQKKSTLGTSSEDDEEKEPVLQAAGAWWHWPANRPIDKHWQREVAFFCYHFGGCCRFFLSILCLTSQS